MMVSWRSSPWKEAAKMEYMQGRSEWWVGRMGMVVLGFGSLSCVCGGRGVLGVGYDA
jgi:hypothetical protein